MSDWNPNTDYWATSEEQKKGDSPATVGSHLAEAQVIQPKKNKKSKKDKDKAKSNLSQSGVYSNSNSPTLKVS